MLPLYAFKAWPGTPLPSPFMYNSLPKTSLDTIWCLTKTISFCSRRGAESHEQIQNGEDRTDRKQISVNNR